MSYSTPFIVAKVADLGLTTFYFFAFALVAAVVLNILTQMYEKYTATSTAGAKKSNLRMMLEIVANIFFIAVTLWVIRNIVERIPFPLEGYGGYKHARLSEINIMLISSITLFLFQTSLMAKIQELNGRLFAAGSARWFPKLL